MSIGGINSIGLHPLAQTNGLIAGAFGPGPVARGYVGLASRVSEHQSVESTSPVSLARFPPRFGQGATENLLAPGYQRSPDGDEALLSASALEFSLATAPTSTGDLTDAPLSDGQVGSDSADGTSGAGLGGGGGATIDDDADAGVDGGDVSGEDPVFERGSANSAFNRDEFPGRGNAYGHFKNEKNPNAVLHAAHGFAFGADPNAVAADEGDGVVDGIDPATDEPIVGEDPVLVASGGPTSESGSLVDAEDTFESDSIDFIA